MKLTRMFEIVYILLERKKVTADELADHFEVSKRTILRDIEALAIAGIPIYTTKGKGGGISLLDSYVLNKAMLSTDEQNQLLLVLESVSSTKHLDTQSALSKLRTIFNKPAVNWIEVDFSRWGTITSDQQQFETIKKAILEEQILLLHYSNASGQTSTKKVCPLKLVFKAKAWYLQGYCLTKQDYRLYKVNRIIDVQTLTERFSREAYQIPSISPAAESLENLITVKLLFSKELAFRAYDEFSSNNIHKNDDGSLLVVADLVEDYWLYSFLLSLGTGVKVLEPQWVREELLTQISAINAMYS